MIAAYSNRIQDYVILVHLSACLRNLVGMLEDYEHIDEDDSWIGKGSPPEALITSPEIAIRRTKYIQNEIWRCELLSSMISSSDFKRPILIELIKCHEAIGQSDVPAQIALLENKSDEATEICSEGVFRAWDLCGKELFTCQARCSAEAKILFPDGCETKDINNVLGFDLSTSNLNTIPTIELSEIARSWHDQVLHSGIAIQLKWDSLTDESFERLIFCLISETVGYENPEWMTKINASDRGRDLSVYRVYTDSLAGVLRQRVIIQCKHWLSKSINIDEVSSSKEKMKLWEPPRVDIYVIATSGRFTTDAIQYVEKHNQSDSGLRVEIWPESHLERLLSSRPALIDKFGLR